MRVNRRVSVAIGMIAIDGISARGYGLFDATRR